MTRLGTPPKLLMAALGAYLTSRGLQRLAKWGLLGVVCGSLLLHEQLLLFVGKNDSLTGMLLTAAYAPPPRKPPGSTELVRLDLGEQPLATLDEPLLGFAIDTSQVVGGHWWSKAAEVEVGRGARRTTAFDFDRPKLRTLAKALGPAWLRVGGTEADAVYYAEREVGAAALPTGYELAFTWQHWQRMADFLRDTRYSLMFTVNAGPGPRDANGDWRPDNAERALTFAARTNTSATIWELGNEVNGFWFIHGPSARVSGSQYAKDFLTFRKAVRHHFPDARVAGPAGFLWPVMGEPFGDTLGVFADFLRQSGSAADIVTWHYYPQQSRRCPMATRRAAVDTLLHPGYLDETRHWANHLGQLVKQHAPQAQLWLGESGNAQCGGEPGVSDRFASSLWYLDQLGMLARLGQPMIRQTLVGSHYGLLEPDTLTPRPDYWAALLYRRLVGGRVLAVQQSGDNPYLRAYASCTTKHAGVPAGSVTWLFINLHEHLPARLQFDTTARRHWLRVTAPSLASKEAWLNGMPLQLGAATPLIRWTPDDRQRFWRTLPPTRDRERDTLAPRSYAFVVTDTHATACR